MDERMVNVLVRRFTKRQYEIQERDKELTQAKIRDKWPTLLAHYEKELCMGCQHNISSKEANCYWGLLPVTREGQPCPYAGRSPQLDGGVNV